MIDSLKPGQKIRCTLLKTLTKGDDRDTIMRIMRHDPAIKKGLRKAQDRRLGRLNIRSRGGRPWAVREKASKVASTEKGDEFTVVWAPLYAGDFKAVEKHLKIESV